MKENEFVQPIREFFLGASIVLAFMCILIFVPYWTALSGTYLIPDLFFKGEEAFILWVFGLFADVIIASFINLSCSLGHDLYEMTIEVKEAHEKADIEKERIEKEMEEERKSYIRGKE